MFTPSYKYWKTQDKTNKLQPFEIIEKNRYIFFVLPMIKVLFMALKRPFSELDWLQTPEIWCGITLCTWNVRWTIRSRSNPTKSALKSLK